jgi:hypothetical protein
MAGPSAVFKMLNVKQQAEIGRETEGRHRREHSREGKSRRSRK